MTTLAGVTHRHPEILSGTMVFVGTRVPVRSLFDYLEGGDTVEQFLHQFPSVKREQVVAVLEAARKEVAEDASTAG
jgi:uncharacterized protein (DUF433 family)